MNTEPALRLDGDEIEDQIIDELLDRALGRGWGITLWDGTISDGGVIVVRRCHDKATIRAAMKSTDADVLYFTGVDGMSHGWVLLIYGNGEDLISDLSYRREVIALESQVHARFEPPHDPADDYADRAAWQGHRAMSGGR